MTSIVTTTISFAAAQTPSLTPANNQQAQTTTAAQTAQISQVASQQDPERVSNDKARATQDPKRTEASFSSPEHKDDDEASTVKSKLRRKSGQGRNLDLVA